ncbi:MAG: PAS domain S-box protein [Parvularculaceae bacterium]
MIAELQAAMSSAPNRRRFGDAPTPREKKKIKAERDALLFRGALVAIGISAINAGITIVAAWSDVDRLVLLGWAGAVMALALAHLILWNRFRRRKTAHGLGQFARLHVVAMGLNGALWGALAPIFAAHGMIGHAFLPFIIAGMTAAAIVSAGASWRAVMAFNIPALIPLAATYALVAGPDGAAIAAVVLLYGVAAGYLGWTTKQTIERSIWLRWRNNRLYQALQKQLDDTHEAEQRYRALVESSHDLTIIFSPEGRITYASPSVKVVLNVAPDKIIGLMTKDILHEDDLPLFRAVGEKSLSRLGEVMPLSHVCMKGADGDFVALAGRLTNMLYVPGVEGFVFNGGRLDPRDAARIHAAE